MSKLRILAGAFAAFLAVAGLAAPAHAQASRTWVSGVGDDANPCARTAPCKTFAGAISKTATGGEINCLDSGGFGAVTITKPITFDCAGVHGSLLTAGTHGIIINMSESLYPDGAVILRNLSFNGFAQPGGFNAIRFLGGGGSLHVENVGIFRYSGLGIEFVPASSADLFVQNTTISQTAGGILVDPAAGASVRAFVDNVNIEDTLGHGFNAVTTSGGDVIAILDGVEITHNTAVGVRAQGADSIIVLDNSTVASNASGLAAGAGSHIQSAGNNLVIHNTSNGNPTSTVVLK
jgi:hypothetical protein